MNSYAHNLDGASTRTQYLRVFLLGFAAFVFNTNEFVPVGLLTSIATDLSVPTARVGWMLTVYAWVVAVMSLPAMIFTSKLDRKKLMLYTFGLFVIGNAVSVIAWNFSTLIISRTLIALAHSAFWSMTPSMIIRVAPWGKKNFALSVLATGTGLAMVLGVPLGRLIGEFFGWRATFAVIDISGIIITLLMLKLLPNLPSLFSGSISSITTILRKPILWCMYGFLFVYFTAHYTAYSYIEPFLQNIGHTSRGFTTLVLLLFGCAGIMGSVIFGMFGEKANKQFFIGCVSIVTISLFILNTASANNIATICMILFWGSTFMITGISIQARVINVDPKAADIIMSLFSGIINLGIGSGALFGNQTIQHLGLANIGYVGGTFGLIAILVAVVILRLQGKLDRMAATSEEASSN